MKDKEYMNCFEKQIGKLPKKTGFLYYFEYSNEKYIVKRLKYPKELNNLEQLNQDYNFELPEGNLLPILRLSN